MTSRMQLCTFASREYLPFARALAARLRIHHPDDELAVLLVDDLDHEVDAACEPFRCVRNEELGLDLAEIHRMYLMHGRMFLAAIKYFYIDHLVRTTGLPTLFVDTDIAVYGSLSDLAPHIEEHGVALFPHARQPYPMDGRMPDDTTILSAGTFNDGMIGVGMRGLPFLEFLKGRLRRECVVDPQRMRVCAQRWIDYAPGFFDCYVVRDPGLNAAYWNLHERPLREVDGKVYAGDAPLRAFHFSGYEPEQPSVISKHAPNPRTVLADEPVLQQLCQEYIESLMVYGRAAHRGIPLPFDRLPGGIPVDDVLRTIYRDAVIAAEAVGAPLPPDGYDLSARPAFIEWAKSAYPARGVEPPAWAKPPAPSMEEVFVAFAQSTSEAMGRLNQRISDLESLVLSLGQDRRPSRPQGGGRSTLVGAPQNNHGGRGLAGTGS